MINLDFRKATTEDIVTLLEIYNHYVINTTATFHEAPLSEKEMAALIFFDQPRYMTYTLELDSCVLGYVILSQHKKREAYDSTGEVTLYLNPEHVGRGLGKKAVAFIEGIAKENDFHVLIATVSGENRVSMELFEKMGYSKCAHYHQVGRKFGRWLDVVALEKILD